MIKTYEVRDLRDAMEVLLHQTYNEDLGRIRSDYLYRGMPDVDFKLKTSLHLNCKDLSYSLEDSMLRYFTKYAVQDEPNIKQSIWMTLVLGQHYGLPTRLLDWSHSPLIAMHFATAENDMSMTDKRDGVIWRIDERELSAILPEKYRAKLEEYHTDVFSIPSINEVATSLKQYDEDMDGKAVAVLEPPSTNQRIINQYSYFTVMPKGLDSFEDFLYNNTENTRKIIIDKEVRWEVRDLLDQLNISERIVYPGLEGLTKWIKRHYFVK